MVLHVIYLSTDLHSACNMLLCQSPVGFICAWMGNSTSQVFDWTWSSFRCSQHAQLDHVLGLKTLQDQILLCPHLNVQYAGWPQAGTVVPT